MTIQHIIATETRHTFALAAAGRSLCMVEVVQESDGVRVSDGVRIAVYLEDPDVRVSFIVAPA